jgi:hypothetical protein
VPLEILGPLFDNLGLHERSEDGHDAQPGGFSHVNEKVKPGRKVTFQREMAGG